jgi:hypothetical protein
MQVISKSGDKGTSVRILVPENESDLELLEALEAKGKVDRDHSFGDALEEKQEPKAGAGE